tara:strand:- start:170 stop:322 length:153 start_codon:yes stop_codon:yes gene_type:complete
MDHINSTRVQEMPDPEPPEKTEEKPEEPEEPQTEEGCKLTLEEIIELISF